MRAVDYSGLFAGVTKQKGRKPNLYEYEQYCSKQGGREVPGVQVQILQYSTVPERHLLSTVACSVPEVKVHSCASLVYLLLQQIVSTRLSVYGCTIVASHIIASREFDVVPVL